jgi:hypothetical protein
MMEVITMDDKAKRDDMFHRYRAEGDDLERQVVKFSDCRLLVSSEVEGEIVVDNSGRARYISTWSISYPSNRSVRRRYPGSKIPESIQEKL